MWLLPYILWAFVALFVWWFCGMLGLVFETLWNEVENARIGYRVNGPLTPSEKQRDIWAGPLAMIIIGACLIISLWRWKVSTGLFIRPFAVVGSKVGDWLVTTFITKSKGF